MFQPTATTVLRMRGSTWLPATRLVLLAVAASLFTAASAQIAVAVPFSPVPLTGQTLAVLLTGALLGPRVGALAMLLYLGEGAAGLPFFAAGAGGLSILSAATAGYLLAFPVAAFVAGLLVDREAGRYRVAPIVLALLLADALIFLGGVAWLAHSLHLGPQRAADLGLWPYIPGDLVKVVLVAVTLQSGRGLLRRG